jgi:sec-independent protein translocase protein TatC
MVDEDKQKEEKEELAEGTLISHLLELRQRMIKSIAAIVLAFVALLPFQQEIFEFVSKPLEDALPENGQLIAIGAISLFMTPLKTTFYVALFLAMPILLFQGWRFVAPGLYRKEKRFGLPLIVSSIVLFYMGVAFAYYVVFHLVFSFMVSVGPQNVLPAPDIAEFLSFALRIVLAFGLAFEVPIATFMLVWSRLVPLKTLSKARPYVFLGAFVVGMFMTPPDAISQTLLALPIYALYETGLIMSRIMLRDQLKKSLDEAEET